MAEASDTKYREQDHTMLIRLDSKVDYIVKSLGEFKDGITGRISIVEQGLLSVTRLHDEVQPAVVKSQTEKNAQWIHDFSIRWKFIIAITAALSSVITFIFSLLVVWGQFFENMKH